MTRLAGAGMDNQQTVERIFATHLEDWPALLRSLRLVGEDARQKSS